MRPPAPSAFPCIRLIRRTRARVCRRQMGQCAAHATFGCQGWLPAVTGGWASTVPTPGLTLFAANSSRIKGPATHHSKRWLPRVTPDSLSNGTQGKIRLIYLISLNIGQIKGSRAHLIRSDNINLKQSVGYFNYSITKNVKFLWVYHLEDGLDQSGPASFDDVFPWAIMPSQFQLMHANPDYAQDTRH